METIVNDAGHVLYRGGTQTNNGPTRFGQGSLRRTELQFFIDDMFNS